jgi:tetratricopeptide (TPR) repeat protein
MHPEHPPGIHRLRPGRAGRRSYTRFEAAAREDEMPGKIAKPRTPRAKKPAAPRSQLTLEKTMLGISRLLDDKGFADVGELNAFLASLNGSGLQQMSEAANLSAREEAQELAFDAMEATTAAQARKLAQRALAKDPDCVDALVALTGLDASSPKQAIEGLLRAIAAGERSLGAEFFKENKGDFWGLVETRPYMRARQQLAEMLHAAGRNRDASAHYEAMLELNPKDNQGVREPLLGLYLMRKNPADAHKLLRRYEGDVSAAFAWGRVLERFLAADRAAATAALKTARKTNRFVELYMTAQLPFPKEMPEMYQLGSLEEAAVCLDSIAAAWAAHPEAMMWLLSKLLPPLAPATSAPRGSRQKKNIIQ